MDEGATPIQPATSAAVDLTTPLGSSSNGRFGATMTALAPLSRIRNAASAGRSAAEVALGARQLRLV